MHIYTIDWFRYCQHTETVHNNFSVVVNKLTMVMSTDQKCSFPLNLTLRVIAYLFPPRSLKQEHHRPILLPVLLLLLLLLLCFCCCYSCCSSSSSLKAIGNDVHCRCNCQSQISNLQKQVPVPHTHTTQDNIIVLSFVLLSINNVNVGHNLSCSQFITE